MRRFAPIKNTFNLHLSISPYRHFPNQCSDNVLTHLYDAIDLDRVIAAVDPALALYREYLDWALNETAGWK